MKRFGWVVVVCIAFAAAGACKKKGEPSGTAPVADVPAADAGVVPAADAEPAVAPDAPAAQAADAGAAAAPPGGGMQLLASLMGGGMARPGLSAPPSAAPGLGMTDLLRTSGRQLLDQAEGSPLAAAMGAAELAGAVAEAEAKATGSQPAGAALEVPPYDPADPCGAFVPVLAACLQSELGESLGPEETAEATAECRTEFAGWTAEQQAKLRSCMSAPDCAARLACVTELEGTVEGDEADDGEEPTGATVGPLPAGADFCTKLAYRTTECVDLPASADVIQPQIDECRRSLDDIPAAMRAQWESCFTRPCDELFDCMSDVDAEDVAAPEGPDASAMLGAMSPPDPARVAALPAELRALCSQFAGKFDQCWDTLIGAAGGADDPSVAEAMAGMRTEMLTMVGNACLQAALDSPPETFLATFGLFKPCFAVPCAQLQDCLMNSATGAGTAEPVL
jgi:hypothetical protein